MRKSDQIITVCLYILLGLALIAATIQLWLPGLNYLVGYQP
jgi:hypothetical protein